MVKNRSISYLTHKKGTTKSLLQDKLFVVPRETTHSQIGQIITDFLILCKSVKSVQSAV